MVRQRVAVFGLMAGLLACGCSGIPAQGGAQVRAPSAEAATTDPTTTPAEEEPAEEAADEPFLDEKGAPIGERFEADYVDAAGNQGSVEVALEIRPPEPRSGQPAYAVLSNEGQDAVSVNGYGLELWEDDGWSQLEGDPMPQLAIETFVEPGEEFEYFLEAFEDGERWPRLLPGSYRVRVFLQPALSAERGVVGTTFEVSE